MIENDTINFQVGEFYVSMELKGSEILNANAKGPDNQQYTLDFVFERTFPETPRCMICRKIGTQYVCEEIECNILVGNTPRST
jgi:hypothetical protein